MLDRNKISAHSGSTVNYTSQSGYKADAGYGYFIQNHPATLDQDGEWYFNAASKKVGVYSAGGITALNNAEIATLDVLVQLQNVSYLKFENLNLQGSNKNAFYLKNTQQVEISNCSILHNGANAFTADNTSGLTVKDCYIDKTNNIGFNGISCTNTVINGNTFKNTGSIAGMGDGNSGSYEGIMIAGNANTISNNIIENTGYIPITFSGDNITINNNYIVNYAFVKDDGGAIYTWNNGSNAVDNRNRNIVNNIITKGTGAPQGTDNPGKTYAHGIYIDDNATDVKIEGNTIADCQGFGIFVHNARNLSVLNNTSYNNLVQLEITHDDIAPNSPVKNITVTGNILFSLQPAQPVAEFKTRLDELASFGTFNNNYYCRPANENATINTLRKINGTYTFQTLDLDGWKQMFGKDAASKISPRQIAQFVINQVNGGNQFSNGSFSSNIGGLYAYAPANNCVTSWNSSALDGGTLQVTFSSQAGNGNKGSVIIGVGSIKAGQPYILKFSCKGSAEQKMLEVYLRKSQAPYNDITDRQLVKITPERKEITLLFVPNETQANASIGIDVPEQQSPFYIDNIQLNEASVTLVNVKDSVAFFTNPSFTNKTFALAATYTDVYSKTYGSAVNVNPFSSAVLIKSGTAAATPANTTPAINCAATGTILREQWNNIGGTTLASNNWASNPSTTSQLSMFEGPVNTGDNYASRISGYICPPVTGNYTFWIAGDDESALYLSTNDNPAHKIKIAYVLSWAASREWNKFTTQKSQPILLEAGKKYYVEAIQKEGGGGDNLAVAWQLPDGTMEAPIPGSRLSPVTIQPMPVLLTQSISFAPVAELTMGAAPQLLQASATSGLPVSLKVLSGPATISGNLLTITNAGTIVIEASQAGNAQYQPAAPVTKSITVLPNNQCNTTGTILWEYWSAVGGNTIGSNDWNKTPNTTKQLTLFEGPTNTADSYASRFRGYLCAPQNGNYTFWIAGDDATELYLSTDANPANKQKIAYNLSWVGVRDWTKMSSQKSAAIKLEAGKKYYIEAIHKEGAGGDNLAVGWQLPDGSLERPIPGLRLSPYTLNVAARQATNAKVPMALEATKQNTLSVYPNPVTNKAIISFLPVASNQVTLELTDVHGRKLSTLFKGLVNEGTVKNIDFSSTGLADGIYIIRYLNGSTLATKQVIVNK